MSCPPSQVYGLESGSLEAYAFDSAVVMWGSAFDADLHEAVNGAKTDQARAAAQARVLRRWLPSERRYADPGKPR